MPREIREQPLDDIPECCYCKNRHLASLVQCRICKKWFCNSTELSAGSHIFIHLSLSKHKCIQGSKQSQFRGKILRCSTCNSNNVFDLRYNISKSGGVPILKCVSNCLSVACLKESGYDDSSWKPVISERHIVPEIIPISPFHTRNDINLTYDLIREYEYLCLSNPRTQISRVRVSQPQNLQKVKQDYEDTLEYYNVFEPLLKLEDSYQRQQMQMDGDKHSYVRFNREENNGSTNVVAFFDIHTSEYSRELRQFDEVVLSWCAVQDDLDNDEIQDEEEGYKRRLAALESRRKKAIISDESDALIQLLNDEEDELDDNHQEMKTVQVSSRYSHVDINSRVEYYGQILRLRNKDPSLGLYECKVSITRKVIPKQRHAFENGYYDIRLRDVTTVLERRIKAMKLLDDEDATDQVIFDILLGNRRRMNHHDFYIPHREQDDMDLNAPNLRSLNESQREAVLQALTSRVTLIQGPPGTGKTATAATIVYQLVQRARQNLSDIPKSHKEDYGDPKKAYLYYSPGPILVCAPSNVAADEICSRIQRTGVKVVRYMARSKQDLPSPIEDLCVHVQAKHLIDELNPEYATIHDQRKNGETISQAAWRAYLRDEKACQRKIIIGAEVVVSTCDSAGASVFEGLRFNSVLIDEASQATEPECLIPITHGSQRLILVGDQCQLQPVILCPQCKMCNLDLSLFERLFSIGMKVNLLRSQYRMHPILSAFSNHAFYEDKLKDGITERNRPILQKLDYPNKKAPLCFWHVIGSETVGRTGNSYMNMTEGKCVIELVQHLLSCGVKTSQIGIITSYTGQRLLLQTLLAKSHITDVELASVNMYQGREKDYIIFSCVRSNMNNTIGFLKDQKRLNVSLTRARYGLFVVGNASLLKSDTIWNMYIRFHQGFKTLVEGKMGHWRVIDNANW